MRALIALLMLLVATRVYSAAPQARVVVDLLDFYSERQATNVMSDDRLLATSCGGPSLMGLLCHPASGLGDYSWEVKLPKILKGERLFFVGYGGLQDARQLGLAPDADGVGFGLTVNGQRLARAEFLANGWAPLAADITGWQGKRVKLGLELDALSNAALDWSDWGKPRVLSLPAEAFVPEKAPAYKLALPTPLTRQGVVLLRLIPEGAGPITVVCGSTKLVIPTGAVPAEGLLSLIEARGASQVEIAGGTGTLVAAAEYEGRAEVLAFGGLRALSPPYEPLAVSLALRSAGEGDLEAITPVEVRLDGKLVSCAVTESSAPAPQHEVTRLVLGLPTASAGFHKLEGVFQQGTQRFTASGQVGVGAPGQQQLDNDKLRLVFADLPKGQTGPAFLYHKVGEEWALAGTFANAATFAGEGKALPQELYAEQVSLLASEGVQVARLPLGGLPEGLSGLVTYMLKAGADEVEVTLKLTTSKPVALGHLGLPTYLACDGQPLSKRSAAVFPGLEWLNRDERSSGIYFANWPLSERLVPHPYKVTTPYLAVTYGQTTTGITWKPLAEWLPGQALPSAEFASPDWRCGREGALMRLFVPSVPDFVDENTEVASRPLSLEPGQGVNLRAEVFALASSEVTSAERYWLARQELPASDAPRDELDQLELCVRTITRQFWDAESRGWWHNDRTQLDSCPGLIQLLMVASEVLAPYSPEVALETRRQVKEALAGRLEARGAGGLVGGATHGNTEQLPFLVGYLTAMAGQHELAAAGHGQALRPDGTVPFWGGPNADPRWGEVGTASSGMVAGFVAGGLRYSRIFGDTKPLAALLKGLDWVNSEPRPEGVALWELQLRCPDQLASAAAIRANCDAYQLTGEPRYLEAARLWAERGLPFCYKWQLPDRAGMVWATVSNFGATHFSIPWFGRPVQWVGLEYSAALRQLAPLDDGFDWNQVAEGILTSAMYQQVEEGEWEGALVDSWTLLDDKTYAPMIAPESQLRQGLQSLGFAVEATTVQAATPEGPITVSSCGKLKASWADKTLTIEASPLLKLPAYGVVCNLTAPAAVSYKGQRLEQHWPLEEAASGWWYEAETCRLYYKLPPAGGALWLLGVRYQEPHLQRIVFDFSVGPCGWFEANYIAPFTPAPAGLLVKALAGDPFSYGPFMEVTAGAVRTLRITLSSNQAGTVALRWQREDSTNEVAQTLEFDVLGDGALHTYELPVGEHPEWEGLITRLRLDLLEQGADSVPYEGVLASIEGG